MSDYITIPLSKTGKHAGLYEAIVSSEDTDLVQLNWNVQISVKSLTKYASRSYKTNGKSMNIPLHRMIMERKLDRPLEKGEEDAMKTLRFMTTKALLAMDMHQMTVQQQLAEAQQQLVEAQQKIIALQQQVLDMSPKNVPDEEVMWHIHSKGILSSQAANSDNLDEVRRFRDWNVKFAKKHIKPYVNPTVYSECLNQMTRGLAERIGDLTSERDMQALSKPPKQKKAAKSDILQLPLIKDA